MGANCTIVQFSSIVPPGSYGGAERVISTTTADLNRRGFSVRNIGLGPRPEADVHSIRNLYWPFDGLERGRIARLAWHGIDVYAPMARRTVARALDDIAPDVVVTHNIRGWGYAPWRETARRGIPLVHVLHDYSLICNSSTLWRGESCQRLCGLCRLRANASSRQWPGGTVTAVSQALVDEYRGHEATVTAGDVIVTHPIAAAAPVAAREPQPLANRPAAVIGYLGRLGPSKGVDLLFQAIVDGSQRLLVGGTGDKHFVRELLHTASAQVEMLGWCDPMHFFPRLELLVVPSAWPEPYGLIVVEAARAGVPVLLADQPGLIEAARTSGARYSTFATGDVDDLRAALRRPLSEYESCRVTSTSDLSEVIIAAALNGKSVSVGRRRVVPFRRKRH